MKTFLYKSLIITTHLIPLGLRYNSILLPSGLLITGHSKCINFLRHYNSGSLPSNLPPQDSDSPNIDPNYISGLAQADGSFFCTISKNVGSKFGIRLRPTFSITLDLSSISVLVSIKDYFKCGYITINENTNSAEFTVKSMTDLLDIIIPHFKQYPLHSAKQYSFLMLVLIVDILKDKKHYDPQVLAQLIKMIYSMNEVTNRTITQEKALFSFLGIPYVDFCSVKPELTYPLLNPAFLAGLIDGDGSFHVSFLAGGKIKPGFHLTQHYTLRGLLDTVLSFFSCGTIQEKGSVIRYQIDKFDDIVNVLIPFMENNTLHTDKNTHYHIFKEVCILMKDNKELSKEDLLRIIDLAYNMNKDGKRRVMSKEEYIAKYIM